MNTQPTRRRKRVSTTVKIAFACVLVVFLIVSIKMNVDINDKKEQLKKMQLELEKKQLEIERTESEIRSFELNEETIKKIAREKLGLRENDTIIFENSQPN